MKEILTVNFRRKASEDYELSIDGGPGVTFEIEGSFIVLRKFDGKSRVLWRQIIPSTEIEGVCTELIS